MCCDTDRRDNPTQAVSHLISSHPAVMTPRPTMTATLSCSCARTPSPRLCCLLLAGLSDVDELKVALDCRFALDVFTIAQQDNYPRRPRSCDPLGPRSGVDLPGPSPQHGWTCTRYRPVPLLITTLVKVHTDLTSLLSVVASIEPARVPPPRLLARTERHQAQGRLVPARPVRRVCIGALAATV